MSSELLIEVMMRSRTITTLMLAILLGATAAPLLSQKPPARNSLLAKLKTSYNLTQMGFADSRVTAPGSVYVVHVNGLLARAIADHVTPTTIIKDGQPQVATKGLSGWFGSSGDTRPVVQGESFYVVAIEIKDDGIVFRLVSLDTHVVMANDQSVQSRFRMLLKFPLSKGVADTLTVADVHHLTDPIFSVEGATAPVPQVQLGESEADVEKAFGRPDRIVDLGSKKVLTYGSLKITLVDNKVTDAE